MDVLQQFFRKRFWLATLPLVAIAASFNARAISELIGTSIALDAPELAAAPIISARTVAPKPARTVSADPILERNPFDHVTGSLLPKEEPTAGGAEMTLDTSDPMSAPVCEKVDVDAIVASDEPDWSFSAISDSNDKTRLVRRGEEVGDKKVLFIGRDRVWLTEGATLCQARLFDGSKKVAKAARTPPPRPSRTALPRRVARNRRTLDPELRKGIQAISPTEFNIDRGVLDRILENQAVLMRQARIIPEQRDGRVVGIRLVGVRRNTLFSVLGMKNGDRLEAINGYEMTSPQRALEAYARLRTADRLTLRLVRRGQRMTLDYNIR